MAFILMNQPLSEQIKMLIFKLVKSPEEKGEILFGRKLVFRASYDEGCTEVLESLCIRRESVLKYLEHKYVPTWRPDGARFLKQKCIQLALIKPDGTLFIHIKNSECHKIITDTEHVMHLMEDHGLQFDRNKIIFMVENLKANKDDLPLYNACLREWGKSVPYSSRMTEKFIRFKYKKFIDIAAIKKNSIQKKHLRYLVKMGQIDWELARIVSHNRNFKRGNLFILSKFIKLEAEKKGLNNTIAKW